MKLDVLIRDGRVIDPMAGTDGKKNIGIKNGRIIELPEFGEPIEAARILEAEGYLVTPGLIDSHVHVFDEGCDLGIPADLVMLPYGVTTVGDGGSCGISNYRSFLTGMSRAKLDYKMLVNVSPAGLSTFQYPEQIIPERWDIDQFRRAFDLDRDKLMGLKLRLSDEVVGNYGMDILERCLNLASALNTRLVVHVTDTSLDQAEVVNRLRKGDIYCHVYQGFGETILDEGGRVKNAIFHAHERGVILDAASGKNNFSFEVARKAMAQGLLPDVICSDVSSMNYLTEYIGIGLPYVMSRFLALGMGLADIVKRVTLSAAEVMGISDRAGSLMPGYPADVAVFKLKKGRFVFTDVHNQRIEGGELLVPMATVKQGQLLYKNIEF